MVALIRGKDGRNYYTTEYFQEVEKILRTKEKERRMKGRRQEDIYKSDRDITREECSNTGTIFGLSLAAIFSGVLAVLLAFLWN